MNRHTIDVRRRMRDGRVYTAVTKEGCMLAAVGPGGYATEGPFDNVGEFTVWDRYNPFARGRGEPSVIAFGLTFDAAVTIVGIGAWR